jgi:hypothetical protein
MKRFEIYIAISALITITAKGQYSGSTAGSASPVPSAPSARSAANQGAANSSTFNDGTIPGQPGTTLMRRDQLLPGASTNGLAIGTNPFGFNSNRFGINTNRFQTNFLATGATNGLGNVPTPRPGVMTRIYSSNNPAAVPYAATNRLGPSSSYGTNASTGATPSPPLTPADRTILFSVRQAVQSAFAAGVQPTVNYVVNGGVVTLVGLVPTIEEKLAVQTVAAGVPGVSRVVNNIQVNKTGTASIEASNSVPTTTGTFTRGTVTAINQPRVAMTNRIPSIPTAPTPTSSNNASRIYHSERNGLPPGLENRESLPTGLQNREQLPPGLSNGTNSTSGSTP